MTAPTTTARRIGARMAATAAAVTCALTLTGCDDLDHILDTASAEATPAVSAQVARTPADYDIIRNKAAALPIKGRAPKTGYSRDEFGQAWSDDVSVDGGHNGCDTRNDILARDLVEVTYRGNSRCVIASGVLETEPYTGKRIEFTRGQQTSSAVQIDHVVALSDAWQKGAQQLSASQRRDLANDPRNLLASDGPANMAKGDSDAATWLPANKSFRCDYVSMQVEVKDAYRLWVTAAEAAAIERELRSCPTAR